MFFFFDTINIMIEHLTIKNFGLIDNVSVEFSKGLNILTGETGAGKSILIDGLRFGLGEKISTDAIRDPSLPCIVQIATRIGAEFSASYPAVSEFSPEDGTLIINRTYTPDGKSKIRVNGLSATISQLKELGDRLIDFHGPHDHQMLLSARAHLEILDRLCSMEKEKKEYSLVYERYKQLTGELEELVSLSQTRQRDLELIDHQIQELSKVKLDGESYADITEKQIKMDNSEKLFEAGRLIMEALDNEDTGVSNSLSNAFAHMRALNRIDPGTENLGRILADLQETSSELTSMLRDYLDSLSFEPREAAEINRKKDIYDDIKRKYGPSLEKAAAYLAEISAKRGKLADIEGNTLELETEIQNTLADLGKTADILTKKRRKTAEFLKKTIEQELKELGILHVKFECRIGRKDFDEHGCDDVAFYISPNAGEDLKPLAEIVSSGEAARVMLALKKALIGVDPIPVLIFDEIDAQIGGRLGSVTGNKLKELSVGRQVILITHLPQIASFADTHFKISKKVSGNRAVTSIEKLDHEGSVKELAKMMSGENETGIALTHAKELLDSAKEKKGGNATRVKHKPARS